MLIIGKVAIVELVGTLALGVVRRTRAGPALERPSRG